jgi:hypothetical protein
MYAKPAMSQGSATMNAGTPGQETIMSKRRNPKKDRTARRRRPDADSQPESRLARWEPELSGLVMSGAAPESVPLIGAASVWLARVAGARGPAAGCVTACLVVREALAVFGITSRIRG